MVTFIIDCPRCRSKVAANETGVATHSWIDDAPGAERVRLGNCPRCGCNLVGISELLGYADNESFEEIWSDNVRVYPEPSKKFQSYNIPNTVLISLEEGGKCMQVGANLAACVMFGRTLEAVCRDIMYRHDPDGPQKVMLSKGLKALFERRIIDQRLYEWSQQLQAFRNIASHAEDTTISREDVEDLSVFVNAIIEYIYDLTERYKEFQQRRRDKAGPSTSSVAGEGLS